MRGGSTTKQREEIGKARKAARAIKNTVKKWAAVPVLVAGLMLYSATARTDEKPAEAPAEKTTSLSVSFITGAYDKLSAPILGAEIAGSHTAFDILTFDAKASALSRVADSSALELDEIELDMTVPIAGPLSTTAFAYRSQYYGVLYGVGEAFHLSLPKGFGLHVAPQVIDGSFMPVPVSATLDSKYVSAMLSVIPIANHAAFEKPAPLIGGEASITGHINSFDIFVRAFEMTTLDSDNKASLGALNLQGGVRFNI